jgi:hypothetical protein
MRVYSNHQTKLSVALRKAQSNMYICLNNFSFKIKEMKEGISTPTQPPVEEEPMLPDPKKLVKVET